jgi:hypothetical protein
VSPHRSTLDSALPLSAWAETAELIKSMGYAATSGFPEAGKMVTDAVRARLMSLRCWAIPA